MAFDHDTASVEVNHMRMAFAGLCSIGLLIGAVWLAFLGVGQALSAYSSQSWPSVTGTVVSAGFESGGSGQTYSRTAFVQYRYSVDGKSLTNDRIAFGLRPNFKVDGSMTSERDQKIKALATRPGGSDVLVFHDPDNPADSVLLTGGGLFFLIYLFGSALMLAVAGMLVLLMTGRVNVPVYRRR